MLNVYKNEEKRILWFYFYNNIDVVDLFHLRQNLELYASNQIQLNIIMHYDERSKLLHNKWHSDVILSLKTYKNSVKSVYLTGLQGHLAYFIKLYEAVLKVNGLSYLYFDTALDIEKTLSIKLSTNNESFFKRVS